MFGLNTENAACSQDRVVNFGQAAIGTGKNEVVQHVWTASAECTPDSQRADPACDQPHDVTGRRAENQRKQQGASDREKNCGRADVGDSSRHSLRIVICECE